MLEKEYKRLEEERRRLVSLGSDLKKQSKSGEKDVEVSSPKTFTAEETVWDIVSGNLYPGTRDIDCLHVKIEREMQKKTYRALLESVTPVLRNENGESLLHIAGTLGNLDLISALLKLNEKLASGDDVRCCVVDPGCIDNAAKLTTALHEVARSGWSDDVVNILVDTGAVLDERDFHGDTPLHCAVRNGHRHTVKSLLKADKELISLTVRNDKHRTPLDLAKLYQLRRMTNSDQNPSYADIVEMLEEHVRKVKSDRRKKFFRKNQRKRKAASNSNYSSFYSEYAVIERTKKRPTNPNQHTKHEKEEMGLQNNDVLALLPNRAKSTSKLITLKAVTKIKRVKQAGSFNKKQQLSPISPQQKKKGLRKLKSISSLRTKTTAFRNKNQIYNIQNK
mmetsp:Transcript_18825/g.23078  ORF Transcript_18825/g.23078 Transcript_18825/m.23078 type:complete len:392 (+) Transcript_18825:104-1279(+)